MTCESTETSRYDKLAVAIRVSVENRRGSSIVIAVDEVAGGVAPHPEGAADHVGVALAVLPASSAVAEGKMVATLKIIPYALSEVEVRRGEVIASGPRASEPPILRLSEIPPRRVGLVLSGSPAARAVPGGGHCSRGCSPRTWWSGC